MNTRSLMWVVTLLILIMAASAACGPTAPASPAPPSADVVIQLSWTPNVEFSGIFMAVKEGFYEAEGLNVIIPPSGFNEDGSYISAIDKVLSGEAQFGITEGGDLLLARANGKDLVAVMSIYQRHPITLLSLAEKGIIRPADLVGHTVDMSSKTMPLYLALLESQGIDPDSVNTRSRTDPSTAPLLTGSADVIDGWVTNEVVELLAEGYEINSFMLSDYGIDAYPNLIFTTEAIINSNPDLVGRFVRATIKGLQAAIADPNGAAELALTYNEQLELDAQRNGMQRALALLNPSGSKLGMMTDATWEFMHQVLVEQGIIAEPIDFRKAYTTRFVDQAYAS
ncbi:MAG: ABC transporter substrate-binding protein [Aggregatilineales bacterium]